MKNLNKLAALAFAAICTFASCKEENGMSSDELMQRENRIKNMPKTTMTIDETRHNFGTIKEGDIVKHTFHVTNTGAAPLLIARVIVSCGCTVPEIPKDSILPGQQGDLTLQFDSHNKAGHVDKSVMVVSNAEQDRTPITFTAEVVKK